MFFNREGRQEDSLYHDAVTLTGITDTSQFPIVQFTRYANNRYREADTLIWQNTGTWEFDDSNLSGLPVATRDLVAGQQDYNIPSTARKIDRAAVLDSDGNYQQIYPIDKSQVQGEDMSQFYEEDGLPRYYDMVGRQMLLHPKPSADDVTTSEGLKLYYVRDISEFAITDTATEPGFDNHFHRLISLGSAYDYCMANAMPERMGVIKNELQILQQQMGDFYGMRHREMQPKLRPHDVDGI